MVHEVYPGKDGIIRAVQFNGILERPVQHLYPLELSCDQARGMRLETPIADLNPNAPFDTSSNLLLDALKWEKLSLRRKKQKALIMYKTIHDLAPEYLQRLFSQRDAEYNLRNLEGKLTLPKPNTNYLKRSFCYSGACLWNNLPQYVRNADLLDSPNAQSSKYLTYRIPTRQSCKTVVKRFLLFLAQLMIFRV